MPMVSITMEKRRLAQDRAAITTRSISMPNTAIARHGARDRQPVRQAEQAVGGPAKRPPSIISSPWAKLTVSVAL
jgi:hypothetical protein